MIPLFSHKFFTDEELDVVHKFGQCEPHYFTNRLRIKEISQTDNEDAIYFGNRVHTPSSNAVFFTVNAEVEICGRLHDSWVCPQEWVLYEGNKLVHKYSDLADLTIRMYGAPLSWGPVFRPSHRIIFILSAGGAYNKTQMTRGNLVQKLWTELWFQLVQEASPYNCFLELQLCPEGNQTIQDLVKEPDLLKLKFNL